MGDLWRDKSKLRTQDLCGIRGAMTRNWLLYCFSFCDKALVMARRDADQEECPNLCPVCLYQRVLAGADIHKKLCV